MKNLTTYQKEILILANTILVNYFNNESITDNTKIFCLKTIVDKYNNTPKSVLIDHKLNILHCSIDYIQNTRSSLICFENAVLLALESDNQFSIDKLPINNIIEIILKFNI